MPKILHKFAVRSFMPYSTTTPNSNSKGGGKVDKSPTSSPAVVTTAISKPTMSMRSLFSFLPSARSSSSTRRNNKNTSSSNTSSNMSHRSRRRANVLRQKRLSVVRQFVASPQDDITTFIKTTRRTASSDIHRDSTSSRSSTFCSEEDDETEHADFQFDEEEDAVVLDTTTITGAEDAMMDAMMDDAATAVGENENAMEESKQVRWHADVDALEQERQALVQALGRPRFILKPNKRKVDYYQEFFAARQQEQQEQLRQLRQEQKQQQRQRPVFQNYNGKDLLEV